MNFIIENINIAETMANQRISLITENCTFADSVAKTKTDFISKLPFHLNVITSAARGRLRETGHSRILADMLGVDFIQKSFIRYFLKIETEALAVEREIGNSESHIDVMMHNKDLCIIIENKVNDATEQPNQTYRYVHDIAIGQYNMRPEQIYVLYLNSTDHSKPSPVSITDQNGNNDVMELLSERFIIKSFAYDITEWLRQLEAPKDEQPYIESAIKQYIDYLEQYFNTSEEFTPMKEELKKQILSQYGLSDSSNEEIISTLMQKKENINILLEEINSIIESSQLEQAKTQLETYFQQMKKDFPEIPENRLHHRIVDRDENGECWPNIGITFIIRNNLQINVHIEYSYIKKKTYFGIISDPDTYNQIKESLLPYFNPDEIYSSDIWPIYCYASYETIYDKFKNLVTYIQKLQS